MNLKANSELQGGAPIAALDVPKNSNVLRNFPGNSDHPYYTLCPL